MPLPYTREPARIDAAGAPPPPEPSLWESVPAAFRATVDVTPAWQLQRLREAYGPVVTALQEREGTSLRDYLTTRDRFSALDGGLDTDKVWEAVEAARARDPKAFGNLPKTKAEFETPVLTRQGATARDAEIAARGGIAPQLIGGLGASFVDPVNLLAGAATGGLSKGLPVLKAMLLDGALNAGIVAATAPTSIRARERVGQTVTSGDIALEIGTGFLFGAAFRGAGEVPGAIRGQFEKVVASNWDRLPEGLRTRWEARASLEPSAADRLLADLSEELIGRDRLTEAQADALAVIRREADLDAANPFLRNGAGEAAHIEAVAQTMARIMGDEPAAKPAFVAPATGGALPSAMAGVPRAGTAIQSGVVAGDATARFMRRVRAAESSGNDLAAASTSSAFGRYQFTRGTWISYFTRRFGSQGLSREQILAKRSDGRLQDLLMGDLTADNAARLRRIGAPVTEGNLYLAHFLGPADAERVLRASPDTPLAGLIDAGSIEANASILRGRTAGDAIAFADRKMGGGGSAGSGMHVRGDGGIEPSLRAQIDAELAQVRAETARIEADLREQGVDTDAALAEVMGAEAIGGDAALRPVDGPEMLLDAPERPRAPDAPPPEIEAIMAPLREVVADKSRSLNDIDALAADLGATPQEVRQAMQALVREKGGGLAIRRKDGAFIRRNANFGRKVGEGPEDVLEFIARNGGIRDDEGHALGLKGLSRKAASEMISDATRRRAEMKRIGGDRGWKTMTRYNGPLLRHEGRSIDQVGELLWESGYLLGRDGDRPTTADVLEYLDQRIADGKARFSMADTAAPQRDAEAEWDAQLADEALNNAIEDVRWAAVDVLDIFPDRLDSEFLTHAARVRMNEPDLTPEQAVLKATNDYFDAAMMDALDETGDLRYDFFDEGDPEYRPEDFPGEAGDPGPAPDPADAPSRAGFADDAGSGEEAGRIPLEDLPREEAARFLDPDGDAAARQIDALEHDARMAIDPAIAERQRQEAQLKAQAPMRGKAEQDGTMGLGLFDQADQTRFDLGDGEGPTDLKSLFDQLDSDASDLGTIKGCMVPNPKGDA